MKMHPVTAVLVVSTATAFQHVGTLRGPGLRHQCPISSLKGLVRSETDLKFNGGEVLDFQEARQTLVDFCTAPGNAAANMRFMDALNELEYSGNKCEENLVEGHRMRRQLQGRWEVAFSSFMETPVAQLQTGGVVPIKQVVDFNIQDNSLSISTKIPPLSAAIMLNDKYRGVHTVRNMMFDIEARTLEVVQNGVSWAERLENRVQESWFGEAVMLPLQGEEGCVECNPQLKLLHVDDQLALFRNNGGALTLLYRVEERMAEREAQLKKQVQKMYEQEIGVAELPSESREAAEAMQKHMQEELLGYGKTILGVWAALSLFKGAQHIRASDMDPMSAVQLMLWNINHGFDLFANL